MTKNKQPARKLTPMLTQYLGIKKEHPDSILFYRMGDFYEMFFDDATTAAPVLDVQLTSRDKNSDNPIPMCGIPFHAASGYLQKLVSAGFKVALCEQVEDPSQAKGLVKREVIRVVTPALIGDPDIVPEEASNILACLAPREGRWSLCFYDLLGGQASTGDYRERRLLMEAFYRFLPKELLVEQESLEEDWVKDLKKAFPEMVLTVRSHYFQESGPYGVAFESLKAYLRETQKSKDVEFLRDPIPLEGNPAMGLDSTTLRSLEILKGQSLKSEGYSLFSGLNKTQTPMGRRKLKEWLSKPLRDPAGISERIDAVDSMMRENSRTQEVRQFLGQMRDLERLAMKTALGLSLPRDLMAIGRILSSLDPIRERLSLWNSPLLTRIRNSLHPLTPLREELEDALLEPPPANYRDGGIFKETYHEEIGELRRLSFDAKSTIASMESRERERTGIANLKIKYSRVFGYTIEVTKSNLSKVPENYIRKQTIANGERFITEELKHFEEKVVTADQRLKSLEESLFLQLRVKVAAQTHALLENAQRIAELDVLQSFAEVSRERGYTRPEVHEGAELEIVEGRHPVVETLLPPGDFVPNSLSMGDDCRTWVITGPNMAGKSTIMRQVALIAIMAQSGCFVPAKKARLPIFDGIFTRIGSSDDLAQGHSTFMVEMTEVARILNSATENTLILIDEIGRGTSTYDGLSLAWSLLEHIHEHTRAKTLFATHFHELTELEKSLPGLKNASVLVEHWEGEIVFLHKLATGVCQKSYGIDVAKLAGLPKGVIERARELLGCLEGQSRQAQRTRSRALKSHDNQLAFFPPSAHPESGSREGIPKN